MIASVAALGAVAAFVRLIGLFNHSTIPDEAFTIWLSSQPLDTLLHILRTSDFHPPLSYVLAHALLHVTSKAYLFRLIPASSGVVTVVATYFIAARVLGRLAWLPALLVAICPILMYFDRFYRMYAILEMLTVLSWLLLLRALEQPGRGWRWAGYGVALCLSFYTHYLSFFTFGGQVIFVLARQPMQWRYWVSAAGAVALWLPWLPAFLEQLPNGGTAFNSVARLQDRFQLPAFVLTDGLPANIELNAAYLALLWALLAAGVVTAAVRPAYRLALWLLAPVGLQCLYTLFTGRNLISNRYLLNDIFALAILLCVPVAALAATRLRSLGFAVAAALIVLMAAGTADKLFVSKYMAVDWNVYAAFLGARLQPGDVVVFNDSAPWFALSDKPVLLHHRVFTISNPNMAQANVGAIVGYPRVWLINYQSQFSDPHHLIFRALMQTHRPTRTWVTTEEGYQDFAVTTLFVRQ